MLYNINRLTYSLLAKRNGLTDLFSHLDRLEKSQYFTLSQIRDEQFERLRHILQHAYLNTEFYRKRFNLYDFNPDKLQSFDDLKKIPPLSKNDIREYGSNILAKNIPENRWERSSSGGTTGIMTWFYRNREVLAPKEAAILRFEKWTGWKIGEWRSIIWPAVMDIKFKRSWKSKLKNFLSTRTLTLPLTVIEENSVKTHLDEIIRKKVSVIRTFPIPITEVARFCQEKDISGFQLKGVVTTGEQLHRQQRNLIEKVFGCPVFDSYRTREIGPIAQECEQHDGLHINAEEVYLEIDHNETGGKPEGDYGKILVTDLLNEAMPFIRYEIGDIGMLSDKSCSCGRGLPVLKSVGGRMVDMLFTADGRKIVTITVLPNLVEHLGITNQIQFEQYSVNRLTIRMSEPRPPAEIIEKQRNIAVKIFGEKMRISYDFVDRIPLLTSGKYRLVISHVKDQEKDEK